MDRENELIERVRRRFSVQRARALPGPDSVRSPARSGARQKGGELRVGIGDDAAVLRPRGGRVRALLGARKLNDWVITTDALLENVHFLRKVHPPDSVGYKALARATSDIAAMGARARYFFLTLGLPAECTGRWLDDFLDGMARATRRFGLVLAGGDTTRYPLIVCSLTVMGEVARGGAILRSGARPGDLICVSGRLGEAELGLRLVRRAGAGSSSPRYKGPHKHRRWAELAKKHLYPEPRLALGDWLAANRLATSMIDISDGLSTDLGHICKASGVGATIWSHKIPLIGIPAGLPLGDSDALQLALHGGEDYELLFTVPKRMADRLPKELRGGPLTVIGEITSSKRIVVIDERGRSRPLQAKGWDPFRMRGRR